MNTFTNAAPQSKNLGAQDVSGKKLVLAPVSLPTHLAKVYAYLQKGPVGEAQLVVGDSRASIFGKDSFGLRSKWANHATVFSNVFSDAGNLQALERVQPADAPPPATARLFLDLLPTKVQDYERNPDGSYKRDQAGAPIPTASKIPGFLAKWVVLKVEDVDGEPGFGKGFVLAGDQTDADSQTQSQRYPIRDLEVSSFGSWGDNQAFRLWAPTTQSSTPIDQRLLSEGKFYPYYAAVAARPDPLTSASIVPTLGGSQAVAVSFKRDAYDRNTRSDMYIGDVFIDAYQDLKTPGMPKTWGSFGREHIYEANIETILDLVYPTEYAVADAFGDFTGEEDEQHRFNFISGVSSNNIPYHTYQIVTGASNSVRLTETNNIYAMGGGDGTMNNQLFAALVAEKLSGYGDKLNPLQNSAKFPESIFWDSGFPFKTKEAMASVGSIRKDVAVAVAVYDVDGNVLTDEQERSMAIALKSVFQSYPESDYYGTPAMRTMIVGASAFPIGIEWKKRLPTTYDLAMKAAAYMGASNGKWTPGKAFDDGESNQIVNMRDIQPEWRPADARTKDWDAGLVYPQTYSPSRAFFPALQTIYPDDTSVLNNFFTMMAVVQLQKVGESVHRKFTGTAGLTPDQLVERVNLDIEAKVKDVFDGRYVIVPETTFTADDSLRGYSWTTVIKIYSPMMVTVQTLTIQSNRIEDFQQ